MTGNVQLYLPEADRSLPRMAAPLVGFGEAVKAATDGKVIARETALRMADE